MSPNQVSTYRLLDAIGGNERGKVYRAMDPDSNREVAVKLLSSQSLFTLTAERKFKSQMSALQQLRHPAILPIVDFGDEDNRPFIVTPLMAGGNLTARITSQALAPPQVLAWFEPLAAALDYAAANGFYHMDLKPNNVLFDNRDQPVISDLGLVQVIDSLSAASRATVNPYYVSPEQVRKRPLSPESHVYSLAAMLYHALTGQTLFQGATDRVAMFKHTSETPAGIRKLRPELPEAFENVLEKALEKKREDRYPSAAEFIRELSRAYGGQLTPAQVRPTGAAPTPAKEGITGRRGAVRPDHGTPSAPQPVAAQRMVVALIAAFSVLMCGLILFILMLAEAQ